MPQTRLFASSWPGPGVGAAISSTTSLPSRRMTARMALLRRFFFLPRPIMAAIIGLMFSAPFSWACWTMRAPTAAMRPGR